MERDEPKPVKVKKPKAYERPRGGPAKPIADLMPQIGRAAFRRFGFVQSSVVTRWPEIVGERHAQVCMPESIRFPPGEKSDGILQLVVLPAHAPLMPTTRGLPSGLSTQRSAISSLSGRQ